MRCPGHPGGDRIRKTLILLPLLLIVACSDEADPVTQAVVDEQETLAETLLGTVNSNMGMAPSLDLTMSARADKTEWRVSYTGLLQGDDQKMAQGILTDRRIGREYLFNSRHESTCLVQIKPKVGDWVYIEHDGWGHPLSVEKFSPPAPLAILRVDPQPNWRVTSTTDNSYVLSHAHDPMEWEGIEGVYSVLRVTRNPALLLQHKLMRDGKALSTSWFRDYGEDKIGPVHSSREDCLARNK